MDKVVHKALVKIASPTCSTPLAPIPPSLPRPSILPATPSIYKPSMPSQVPRLAWHTALASSLPWQVPPIGLLRYPFPSSLTLQLPWVYLLHMPFNNDRISVFDLPSVGSSSSTTVLLLVFPLSSFLPLLTVCTTARRSGC